MDKISVLFFDVFGTVVDWRNSISREIKELGHRLNFSADWNQFAIDWRAGYMPAMDTVRTGQVPWKNIDQLHKEILDQLLTKYNINGIIESDKNYLNKVWHRLDPWEDAVEGLHQLREKHIICTLSNGNVELLVNMAKNAKLPWDCVLSAEMFHHYKPDSEVYSRAADLFNYPRSEIMMVAAHKDDLDHARASGLRTAFVPRPHETGFPSDVNYDKKFDINAVNFLDLARKLNNF